MNTKFPTQIIIVLLLALTLFSCASKKKVLYFQSEGQTFQSEALNYEPLLQPDDELMIVVSAKNPELAMPYNLNSIGLSSITLQPNNTMANNYQERLQTYLIDEKGFVTMPVLGPIHLAGMTRIEAIEKIKGLLVNDIKDPVVNVRMLNFKVSVLGEVKNPGIQRVQTDRITVLEALSAAGDLTIYGKRNDILIIREINGAKTIVTVDIGQQDIVNSPYYYLSQNDVVYVQPNKTRVDSSVIGPNVSVILAGLSLLIAVLALTIN